MHALTLALIVIISVSVYAQTEAGYIPPGQNKTGHANRSVATTTAAGLDALNELSKLNQAIQPSAHTDSNHLGFTDSEGTLTAPKKNKPRPKKIRVR